MNPDIELALADGGGLVRRADHPRLSSSLHRAVGRGELVAMLPGVYAASGVAATFQVAVGAAFLDDPDAVARGHAAAALTWWPELKVETIELSSARRHAPAAGYRWGRGGLAIDHVRELAGGVRVADAATTVLDLIPELGGNAIDEALRRGACTLADLRNALAETRGRRDNRQRAWLLDDSCDEPWSEAERAFQRLWRALGLLWKYLTNHRVVTSLGTAFLDFALPELRLGFEIDGYRYHHGRDAFDHDRWRDLGLAAIGWEVRRISASSLDSDPVTLRHLIVTIVAERAELLGLSPRRRLAA